MYIYKYVFSIKKKKMNKNITIKKKKKGDARGRLQSTAKGWLGNKTKLLHQGEGPIYALSWHSHYIAWASDSCVMIWDVHTSQIISYITRPEDSPPPDVFKCHLAWSNETTLLIGWADTVKVAQVYIYILFFH